MVPLRIFKSLAQVQDAMVVVVGQMGGDRCVVTGIGCRTQWGGPNGWVGVVDGGQLVVEGVAGGSSRCWVLLLVEWAVDGSRMGHGVASDN